MLPAFLANIGARMGLKPIKYFIDAVFRDKVIPVAGSIVYCDLWVAAEHSGIYVGDGQISNIVVEGFAESQVQHSDARDFTSKSTIGNKIYVSCNDDGAVGHAYVGNKADAAVGKRSFYGLVFKNCHVFSKDCLDALDDARTNSGFLSWAIDMITPEETWEPTIRALKSTAEKKLGATKWRLWDWEKDSAESNNNSSEQEPPNWQEQHDFFMNCPLNAQSMAAILTELQDMKAYEAEIANENIPNDIRQKLAALRTLLADIDKKHQQSRTFIEHSAGIGWSLSYADLKNSTEDFAALAAELQNNRAIQELVKKMGRNYISEEKKKQIKIPTASKSEVHGTHRSADLMRLLPSELINLEDDTLEMLFYSRLLEQNLMTYELSGITHQAAKTSETHQKRTGPVVACLDTSGSMSGTPILKAKALLLAIANILTTEKRSLHVLLFGDSGQLREFKMENAQEAKGLLAFLGQGFGGGTDFETPLQRACDIIKQEKTYLKADILMISDGDCSLSSEFTARLHIQKSQLDCSIYSVLCAGSRGDDSFSNEVILI